MTPPAPTTAAPVPHLVVVSGPESVLAERAVASVIAAVRAEEQRVGVPPGQRALVTRLEPTEVADSGLDELLSPSLFGERRLLVLQGCHELPEDVAEQVRAHLPGVAAGADDDAPTLVLVHRGGARGRKLLDAALKAGGHEVPCPAMKFDSDKVAFVSRLAREARPRRVITPEAVRALVDALGRDVAELAAGTEQLIAVTEGEIEAETVNLYHGGRIDSSGFTIADAAVEGRAGDALMLLRHGRALGLAPVLVTSALASTLRSVARVAAAPRGLRRDDLARDLGIAPFQVDKARKLVPGWSAEGMAAAIAAVAEADAAVKGAVTDAGYALERVVVTVAGHRARPVGS